MPNHADCDSPHHILETLNSLSRGMIDNDIGRGVRTPAFGCLQPVAK